MNEKKPSSSDGGTTVPATHEDRQAAGSARPTLHQLPQDAEPRYELGPEHARGGVGRVHRAHDRRLERTVAIKALAPEADARAAVRFVREALVTARLQHPGIVPVYDAGSGEDGKPYYAMKLVAGRTLHEAATAARGDDERLALLPHVLAVAEAVAYAHSEGVVHRDLKPSNIMIGDFGETVVLDWGLARDRGLGDEAVEAGTSLYEMTHAQMTHMGSVMGTPAFMSPEQARGEPADTRSDVYSLGAIAYFVLTGKPPYEGESTADVLRRVDSATPTPLRTLARAVPLDLAAIVEKAMARDPGARYPSARELAADLRRHSEGRYVHARDYAWWEPLLRWFLRRRLVAAVTAAFLLLGTAGLVVALRREQHLRQVAESERGRAEVERGQAEQQTLALLETQARHELEAGKPQRASVLLVEALRRQPDRVLFRHLLADALGPSRAHLARLLGHERDVVTVAFSPDGRSLASGASDNTVRVWDVATGTQRLVLRGHERSLEDVIWSPDGTLVASVCGKSTRIWRASDGALLHTIASGGVRLAMSPDSTRLWVGGFTGGVRVIDVASGRELAFTRSHTMRIGGIAYDPDGGRVITAGWDGRLKEWSATSLAELRTVNEERVPLRFLRFRADGRYLLTGDDAGALVVRDGASLAPVRRLTLSSASHATNAWFSADGQLIVSVSADGLIRVWHAGAGYVLATIDAVGQGKLFGASLSPDGHVLATASLRAIDLWQPESAGVFRVFAGASYGESDFGSGVLSADGRHLVAVRTSADEPPWLRVWDAASGELRVTWQDEGRPGSLALSSDGRRIVVGDYSGMPARLYDGETGALLARLAGHTAMVYDVEISPDDRVVATTSYDKTVRFWRAQDGEPMGPVLSVGARVTAVAFDPRAPRVAVSTELGEVRFYDRERGTLLDSFPAHATWIEDISFSPDGTRLLTAGRQDHTGKIWDLERRGAPVLLTGHSDNLIRAAFSPDGATVATASVDGTARLWDARSGELLRTFPGGNQAVAFSPDGATLYVPGWNDSVVAWDLSIDQRSPAALAAVVAATSPWRLDHGRLVLSAPIAPQPTQTRQTRQMQ